MIRLKRSSSSGLELAIEPLLLFCGLEAPMAELGRGVHELELDILKRKTRGLLQQGLAKGDHTLLRPNAASLDHEVVSLHHTVVGEATHGGDVLLGPVRTSSGNRGSLEEQNTCYCNDWTEF